jgi:hypothetical protein
MKICAMGAMTDLRNFMNMPKTKLLMCVSNIPITALTRNVRELVMNLKLCARKQHPSDYDLLISMCRNMIRDAKTCK